MVHVGPGDVASLASAVSSGTPINSARATYTASYMVRLVRNSQHRSISGACGTRRIGSDRRSARANAARRSSSRPAPASRRYAETTSRSIRCGAANCSPKSRCRCRSPSGPSSASAVTTMLASTTINVHRDQHGRPSLRHAWSPARQRADPLARGLHRGSASTPRRSDEREGTPGGTSRPTPRASEAWRAPRPERP